MVITYSLFKDYYGQHVRGEDILNKYAYPFVILSVLVVILTELLIFLVPGTRNLIYSILFINFFYMFVVVISALFYTLEPIKRLFEFQTDHILEKAKNIAASHSKLSDVKKYTTGTNPLIDEILDDVWSRKDNPSPDVRRLEVEICVLRISDLGKAIKLAKMQLKGPAFIKKLEKQKKRFEDLLKELD
jgi:hypothetical protein